MLNNWNIHMIEDSAAVKCKKSKVQNNVHDPPFVKKGEEYRLELEIDDDR